MADTSEQASFDVVAPASLHVEREDQSMTTELIGGVGKPDDTSSPDIPMPPGADLRGLSSSDQYKMTDVVGVASPTVVNQSSETNLETRKRKSSHDEHSLPDTEQTVKRAKVEETLISNRLEQSASPASPGNDRSLLPAEIWQHIFTFVSPRELGNLLLTNRAFHSYLNPSLPVNEHSTHPSVTSKGHLSMLKPDVIWQTSRRRFWPRMPAPLRNHTELQMWRLACCRKCQFCDKRGLPGPAITDHKIRSSPGPGMHGVSIIWPFAVSSCGPCLLDKSLKEIDLFLSSTPSLIIPALPSVLLTKDTNILSLGALQNGQANSDVKLTKLFYKKHVEELKEEFATVKAMGLATVEEWLKGLEDRGKELRADSSRWEKWELAGGISQMRKTLYQTQVEPRHSTSNDGAPLKTHNKVSHDDKAPSSSGLSIPVFTTAPADANVKPTTPHLTHNQEPFPRPVPNRTRTQEEIQEMKAARRLEIERRAALLDPPLPPSVLAHIPSFQAALQIIQPLDDNAWDLLKPRLLAQRKDAEIRNAQDQQLIAHSKDVGVKVEEHCGVNGTHRESKELVDKDWDDAQAPLRGKISGYADETIKDDWRDGQKVKKDNSPKFAVDVLLYVRKRFYAEVAKDAAAARTAGQEPIRDPPEGPFTQKLTLENMKWLFEVKIKPLTEPYRKELFLCNGCDGNSKAYGFEGVIQHYAAKHTSSLSLGNIVVYWRSEWPATPPFHPDPLSKSAHPATSTPTSYAGLHQQPFLPQPPTNYFPQPPPFSVQGATGYGAPPYRPDYGNRQHSYYPQYPTAQPPFPVPPSYNPAYHAPLDRPVMPQPHMPPPMPPAYQHQQQYFTNPYEHSVAAYQRSPVNFGLYSEDRIRTQLDDLAFNSRDVWMALANLKDLPGNIRVSIVIYHLTKRYRSRFSESPPLAMFIDGLSNKKDMRPVRNVNGLKCKACHLHLDDGVELEMRTFSLPQLANHFQQSHVGPFQSTGAPFLDWTTDMIFIPELSGLHNISGMDAHKEALVTEAFPELIAAISRRQPQEIRETGPEWVDTGDYAHTITGTHQEGYGSAVAAPSVTVDVGYPSTSSRYETGLFPEYRYISTPHDYDHEQQAVISHPPQLGAPLAPTGSVNPSPDYGVRSSAATKQELNGRGRDRKSSSKEKRKGANHNNTKRKDNSKSNDIAVKVENSSHEEKDGEAEAEELRQEEAIRAMWAAERRETARLASTPGALKEKKRNGSRSGGTSQITTRVVRMPSSPMSAQKGAYKSPWPASRTVETEPGDDLFASLESHLDQQACSNADVAGSEAMYDGQAVYEAHHVHVSQPGEFVRPASQVMHSRFASYGRTSPPRTAREDDRLQPMHCREQSTPSSALTQGYHGHRIVGPTATVHETAIEPVLREGSLRSHRIGERGDQMLHNPSANEYAEEVVMRREQSHVQYIETYELIRMRDAEGEYFIRRPVRRELDAAHAGPRRLEYRDMGSPSTHYEHEPGSERVLRRPLREEMRERGSIPHEDYAYDPRFGSAPPNSGATTRYR